MPSSPHKLTLRPTGAVVTAEHGAHLRDLLFEQGVEFPCGGNGRCRGCRVRLLEGELPVNAAQQELLTAKERADGWRLACQCRLESDLALEIRQWDASVLVDDSRFAFAPKPGLGVAVDIGTTTLAAQLVDREAGRILGVKTALNPQARWGADVMSRVQYAVADGGAAELTAAIRAEVRKLIRQLLAQAEQPAERLQRVTLAGNTVMHHLFCGIDCEPLSRYPFEPADDGLKVLSARELGWEGVGEPEVAFLPCLGGFVGSDLLAGILATGLHEGDALTALVDLGTNGEIVLGSRAGILCASTAAGPAFEGARISCGMRAATGAIWRVTSREGCLLCETLGSGEPRGICGSGLVDAVAAGLELGLILPTGRFANSTSTLPLAGMVALTQPDIRQLQLAKGAIAAGILLLLDRVGARVGDIDRVYLAGAFGNYVDRANARRIGLLPFADAQIHPAGNTSLLGAKMALFTDDLEFGSIRSLASHVSLNAEAAFIDTYVDEMRFPAVEDVSAGHLMEAAK